MKIRIRRNDTMLHDFLKFCSDDIVRFTACDMMICLFMRFHQCFASVFVYDTSCIGAENYFMLRMFDGMISRLRDIAGE